VLGLEDFEAWNLALGDLQEGVIRVILCLERCVDCVPEFLSRYRGVSLMQSPMSVTSCEQQSICSDLACTTKKWHGFKVPSQLHIPLSRPASLLGRLSLPFRAAGKNARGVGRAWDLRGRHPLSAVRTRTGEGGGRVQSHPAPKPGGGARGVVVRVCVGGAM
jgi:hypothetical protein